MPSIPPGLDRCFCGEWWRRCRRQAPPPRPHRNRPNAFHPKGKAHRLNFGRAAAGAAGFATVRGPARLRESKRGFIAAPPYKQIGTEAGNVAWDMGSFEFLLRAKGLRQRESVACSISGAQHGFRPVQKSYRVASVAGARASTSRYQLHQRATRAGSCSARWCQGSHHSVDLANEKLGARPVVAVDVTRIRIDHFGGVRGVVDEGRREERQGGSSPSGVRRHAIAENVYAGNAMIRRVLSGTTLLLPRGPAAATSTRPSAKAGSSGTTGLIAPAHHRRTSRLTVDGVRMVFQNTPGTEAPARK